jgi:hypothetical protein
MLQSFMQVVCDGSGLGSAWLLDTISVTAKSSGATTWFYAGRWLGRAAGLESVLDGSDADVRGQLVTYKVGVAATGKTAVQDSLVWVMWIYAGRWLGRAAGLEAVLDGSEADVRGQLVTYKVGVRPACCWYRHWEG